MEPTTIKHLADAREALLKAHDGTSNDLVKDHIDRAIEEIRKAISEACKYDEYRKPVVTPKANFYPQREFQK